MSNPASPTWYMKSRWMESDTAYTKELEHLPKPFLVKVIEAANWKEAIQKGDSSLTETEDGWDTDNLFVSSYRVITEEDNGTQGGNLYLQAVTHRTGFDQLITVVPHLCSDDDPPEQTRWLMDCCVARRWGNFIARRWGDTSYPQKEWKITLQHAGEALRKPQITDQDPPKSADLRI